MYVHILSIRIASSLRRLASSGIQLAHSTLYRIQVGTDIADVAQYIEKYFRFFL